MLIATLYGILACLQLKDLDEMCLDQNLEKGQALVIKCVEVREAWRILKASDLVGLVAIIHHLLWSLHPNKKWEVTCLSPFQSRKRKVYPHPHA
eukprot:1147595-Pelagomonas_calceolata.AAC.19